MAQATTVKPRTFSFGSASALTLGGLILAVILTLAAVFAITNVPTDTVAPRSEAVLEAGRAWQRQYESMSGLEARRERYENAVLQSGREWERQQKQISGD
jgi:hypothetical protein